MKTDLKFFVIADDITGAAEIAGLGRSYGLSTSLVTRVPESLADVQLTVLATDTRSMSVADAVAQTRAICAQLRELVSLADVPIRLFKKVDSFMRGHVVD